MKNKVLSIIFAAVLVLVGCQGNNTEEGARDRTDDRIQQTRYDDSLNRNNRMNEGMRDQRQRNDNMTNQKSHDQYDVSKEAAEKITAEVNEVDRAYVLTMNNHAYVAVVIDRNTTRRDDHKNSASNSRTNRKQERDMENYDGEEDLTEEMKKKISDIVRSVDGNIDNVYVSSNPDFIDLSNNYINDFNEGRPIRGMFEQMGEMIERVFPQNKR